MDSHSSNAKSPFEMLPLELRQAVMRALPDVESLKWLVLACSSFHHAFRDAESLITIRVLLNELHLDVLPEAVVVFESARNRSWTRQGIIDFAFQHLNRRIPPPLSWTLADALSISKLYSHVHYFATDFACKCLAIQVLECGVQQSSPSQFEMVRIERTLYRFEIYFEMYCNIFRDFWNPILSVDEQREIILSRFSPCENEQLACIHDYLYGKVSPAFNEISEHDVFWGELRVNYSDISDPGDVEPILARGLSSIHSIVLANTYQDRCNLIYPDYPQYAPDWLFEALNAANDIDDGDWLEDYSDEQLVRVTASFFPESDIGPVEAWVWAHNEESGRQFINTPVRQPLREWGYVMWDNARLHEWKIFQMPWEKPDEYPPTTESLERHPKREALLRKGSEIYRPGGSGWWSFEDESKVIWPKVSDQHPVKQRQKEVASLSEAKDLLLTLKLPF